MFSALVLALLAQSVPSIVLPPHSVPPAAMRPPALLRGPEGRGRAQSYITPFDYPVAAHGASGRVGFILTVGPDGRVIGCTIRRSSGSAVLDETTCLIMERRARYSPAIDSNGTPVAGTIDDEVAWEPR